MRSVCRLSIVLILASAAVALAEQPPRRTTRVASGPVRPAAPEPAAREDAPRTAPVLKPDVPSPATRLAPRRPGVLEPDALLEGVGRGMVASFQVEAERAVFWQLVVTEVAGPVAQIFEGEGPPPRVIPWDGRLLDGGLAWSGVTYTYEMAWVDSTGATDGVVGAAFTLPDYSREEREGLSFLIEGDRFAPGGRRDATAAARAGLRSVVERLEQAGGRGVVRIEVLARREAAALALGETIRDALAGMLVSGERAVDLYVGEASAAPAPGTVLITTVPLPTPSS